MGLPFNALVGAVWGFYQHVYQQGEGGVFCRAERESATCHQVCQHVCQGIAIFVLFLAVF